MAKRNDIHRPGAIIPANYSYQFSYALASTLNGWPVPAINVDLIIKYKKEGKKFAPTGGAGTCSVCGAHFISGDVWRHDPTGEHIYIGHDCADKYALLADRSSWELERKRARDAAAVACIKAEKAERRAEFLADNPGLKEALETDHHIVRDIADRFKQFTSLTPPQVALVFKLAHEAKNPRPVEPKVDAPEGRTSFRGVVVSVKEKDTAFGIVLKMTVKVDTGAGVWLAWGTAPTRVKTSGELFNPERGDVVELTATLKRGDEKYFSFMSRPILTKLERAEGEQGA